MGNTPNEAGAGSPATLTLTMGLVFIAYFAVALASPALGLIAAMTDIGTVFLASALSVLGAAPIALRLRHAPREN